MSGRTVGDIEDALARFGGRIPSDSDLCALCQYERGEREDCETDAGVPFRHTCEKRERLRRTS